VPIVEHALLHVAAASAGAFESAMEMALPLISASEGFEGIEVRPSTDTPGTYLLLVHWRSIDDHRVGFRSSARYQEWRKLLHPFYDPVPEVGYFGESLV
jgi:heme-degrading monooxygenase HmoA